VADLAFAQWNSAPCVSGPPDVQAYDVGALDAGSGDCTASSPCEAPSQNVIVFRDRRWPHDDPVNVLALTTVTYAVNSGEVLQAYTEVNSAEHAVSTVEPPTNGTFDLQAILTHEAGHFFGLAHATDTHPIMYAYYQAGAINLTPDDVGAICAAYDPAPGGGCSCQSAPAGPGLFAAASGLSVAVLARARRRQRKPRRW
jgi:MYXO-CTERM domain-containing protein